MIELYVKAIARIIRRTCLCVRFHRVRSELSRSGEVQQLAHQPDLLHGRALDRGWEEENRTDPPLLQNPGTKNPGQNMEIIFEKLY